MLNRIAAMRLCVCIPWSQAAASALQSAGLVGLPQANSEFPMRIYPPLSKLSIRPRASFIPEWTSIRVPTWCLHRDPRNFVRPLAWVPERWLVADGRAAEVAALVDAVAEGDVEVARVQGGTHVSGRVRNAGHEVPGLLRSLDGAGIALESIEVKRPTLDDVFLSLTGRSLREENS